MPADQGPAPVNNYETNVGSFRGTSRRPPRPEMARRVMDVETVLQWAVNDELPKTEAGGGAYGPGAYASLLGRMVGGAGRVDNWNREPGFPAAMGPPHPDALRVAAAIARLGEAAGQAIDEDLRLMPDFGEFGVDEVAAMRRALATLPAIVTRCAKARRRPDWPRHAFPGPDRAEGGRRARVVRWVQTASRINVKPGHHGELWDRMELVSVEAGGGRDAWPLDSYCPLRYEPSPQAVAEERAEYLAWWGGLDAIALDLAGQLDTIAVLPPAAPQLPWIDADEPSAPPRVFADLSRAYRAEARETAAAHRALGLRRASGARRGGARPGTGPTRLVPSRVAQRA